MKYSQNTLYLRADLGKIRALFDQQIGQYRWICPA